MGRAKVTPAKRSSGTRRLAANQRSGIVSELLRALFPALERMHRIKADNPRTWNADTAQARNVRAIFAEAEAEQQRLEALPDERLIAERDALRAHRQYIENALRAEQEKNEQDARALEIAKKSAAGRSLGPQTRRLRANEKYAELDAAIERAFSAFPSATNKELRKLAERSLPSHAYTESAITERVKIKGKALRAKARASSR